MAASKLARVFSGSASDAFGIGELKRETKVAIEDLHHGDPSILAVLSLKVRWLQPSKS